MLLAADEWREADLAAILQQMKELERQVNLHSSNRA